MAKTKFEKLQEEKEKQEAKEWLLKVLKPNDTVYTVLLHTSKSGMSRVIALLVADENKNITNISYYAGKLLEGYDKRGGCKVSGCGMDMGFHLVYKLASILFGNGYALNQKWI